LTTPTELIFTSGGTEALNWVIRAIDGPVVTTGIEHCAVNACLIGLQIPHEVVHPPTGHYHLIPEDVLARVKPETALVCVQLANNETGAIQPIAQIGHSLSLLSNPPKLLVDASQALGKMEINVASLKCDFLVVAGHKFYGPRTGALWIKQPDQFRPLFFGGGQEGGLRAGTENVADAAGLATAAELVTRDLSSLIGRMKLTRDALYEGIKRIEPKTEWLSSEPMLPNTLLVSIPGIGAKLKQLQEKIIFSTGAACHSGQSCSSVLTSSGIASHVQRDMIRFSTGMMTSLLDIDQALAHLEMVLC